MLDLLVPFWSHLAAAPELLAGLRPQNTPLNPLRVLTYYTISTYFTNNLFFVNVRARTSSRNLSAHFIYSTTLHSSLMYIDAER